MIRRFRAAAAALAIFTTVFAQLAVAAYACPTMGGGTAIAAESPAAHADCGGMPRDIDQSALCLAYCQQGDQTLDKPAPPFPDSAALAAPAFHRSAPPLPMDLASPELPSLLARTTAPPLALRHCCLRL